MVANRHFDYFNLKYIFTFLTIYFVLIPFLFDINFQTFYVLFVVIIGYFSFLIGYSHNKFFLINNNVIPTIRTQIVYFTGLFFLASDLLHGLQNLFTIKTIDDYTGSFAVENYDSLYLQIVGMSIFFIKYYFYSLLMARNKVLFYLVFLSQFLLMHNSSTRLVALSPFIIFFIYGYYMNYIKINFFRILMVFLSLPFVFVVLLLARGKTDGMNYFQLLNNIIDTLTLESFFNILKTALESFKSFEDLTSIITNGIVQIESGVIRIFFMPISRSIWEDKPESISRLISKEYNYEQYVNGGGTVATIFGDAFINGHIIGVFIVLFSLAYLSKILYNTMQNNSNIDIEKRSILILIYAQFVYQFLFHFRGFFSEFYWKTILLIFIFYILYKIQFSIKPIQLKNGKVI